MNLLRRFFHFGRKEQPPAVGFSLPDRGGVRVHVREDGSFEIPIGQWVEVCGRYEFFGMPVKRIRADVTVTYR